ncbi:hypothetical protein ACOME3_009360 [Neoechinorhynchus agilis]
MRHEEERREFRKRLWDPRGLDSFVPGICQTKKKLPRNEHCDHDRPAMADTQVGSLKHVDDRCLFFFDRVGEEPGKTPTYVCPYKVALSDKVTVIQLEEQVISRRTKINCFNCQQEGHIVPDCPFEHNELRIRQNRLKYRKTRQSSLEIPRSYRYHGLAGAGRSRKFANIRPGEYSENLRRALGLRRYQLPPFIYRMRQIGYPSAWLKEIESGFSIHGGGALAAGADDEDRIQYDVEKFVHFQGVTSPVPQGFKDENEKYCVPRYKPDLIPLPKALRTKSPNSTKEHIVRHSTPKNKFHCEDIKLQDSCTNGDNESEDTHEVVTQPKGEQEVELMINDMPQDSLIGSSISVDDGTPILLTEDRMNCKVPDSHNFSAGIGEHRIFENLPGSTGNFQRIIETVKRLKKQN